MITLLKLIIPGTPTPKQSARFRIAKTKTGKQYIHSYQTKDIVEDERSKKIIIKEQLPEGFEIIQGAVIVSKLHYIFPPLKSFSKKTLEQIKQEYIIYKTTAPDLDSNLNKSLFDAMQGIVFLNDSQVCDINNLKKYYGFEPRTEIEICLEPEAEKINSEMEEMELFE